MKSGPPLQTRKKGLDFLNSLIIWKKTFKLIFSEIQNHSLIEHEGLQWETRTGFQQAEIQIVIENSPLEYYPKSLNTNIEHNYDFFYLKYYHLME